MACRLFSDEKAVDEFLACPRRKRSVLNHVQYCPRCQFIARDRRLQRLQCYGDQPGGEKGSHVLPPMLRRFAKEGLNDGQMMQVMDHLRGCALCVAALQALHVSLGSPPASRRAGTAP